MSSLFCWNPGWDRTYEKLSLIRHDINDLIIRGLRRMDNIWHIFTFHCVQSWYYTCSGFLQTLWSCTGRQSLEYSCRRDRSALNVLIRAQNPFPASLLNHPWCIMQLKVLPGYLKSLFSSHAGWLTKSQGIFSGRAQNPGVQGFGLNYSHTYIGRRVWERTGSAGI